MPLERAQQDNPSDNTQITGKQCCEKVNHRNPFEAIHGGDFYVRAGIHAEMCQKWQTPSNPYLTPSRIMVVRHR